MGGNNSAPSHEPRKGESTRAAGHQGVNTLGKTTIDIAITGMTGAGKSSLVNALRGLSDFDESAAQTDVTEGTMEPVGYPHPTFSDVTIWDLPGIGTRRFKAEEYLDKVNYSQYDFFIIVASNRFTAYDMQLAHAVRKMGKRFCYVRSQIDLYITAEKLKPDFTEEATIEHIKKDCRENLVRAGFPSPDICLLSSWYPGKYDFPLLKSIFENEMKDLKKKISRPAVPPENNSLPKPSTRSGLSFILLKKFWKLDLAALIEALEQKTPIEVAQEVQEEFVALRNVTLNIAITGVTGAGKSSLVNALRGMTDYEDGAAEVGAVQTTTEPQAYPHPLFPNVMIWDLPGIGTPHFAPKDYLGKVNFSQYDFFMIVASQRFTENDVLLACEIQKMKKKFDYVRSKMDVSMAAEIRNPNYNREKSLLKIRKYCCDNLILTGESDPNVFLISTRNLSMYDFPLLQEALESDLDDLKSHALILAMPVFSRKMLEKKKAVMESFIWKLALVACVIGAVPVPSLSLVCDIGILTTGLIRFYKVFGLDEESLRRVAELVGKDYKVLKSAIKKSLMFSRVTPELVVVLLARSFLCSTLAVIEEAMRLIPVLGSLVGGASSFFTIYYMLRRFLQDIVEDAESVRAKAAEL